MRQVGLDGRHAARWSALWGTGSRGGDPRAARPLRLAVVAASLAAIIVFPATAAAAAGTVSAFVPAQLLANAQASPTAMFNVIVQGRPGQNSAAIAKDFGGVAGKMKKAFYSIDGVAGSLSGAQLVKLAQNNHVLAITPDVRLKSSAYQSQEVWRDTTGVSTLWKTLNRGGLLAPQAPAIAIVDSGIDSSKVADFGTRVVAHLDFCSLCPAGSTGDLEGHGTMVAGLAAGAGSLYPGVARNANLVDLRTTGADGASRTSDVLAATDWILQNKDRYGIRVANYSMRSANPSSFRYDPLDAAVESLWFNGVVVVAAAGNYGAANTPQVVRYAPGNDPFVITVGATGTQSSKTAADDTLAPWSAYGHTLDGFAKPEISAPGRMLISAVPMGSTLATTAPDRVVAPGYMWMSGTSLSAPVVAGAAAQVLALHPGWTPDQVKGALMASASPLPAVAGYAGGVGEVNVAAAAAIVSPPNPQSNLSAFVAPDPNGRLRFNGDAWVAIVASTDWSETDWSEAGWAQTDWSETDWSETDWSETDWSETDWSETDWSETDWSETDWSE